MGDLDFLLEFVLAVAALTVPVVIGIRILAGDQTADAPWPRGVQEEEPTPWNVQLLDRRSARSRTVEPEQRRPRHRLPLSG
jgi:hypothetical protein